MSGNMNISNLSYKELQALALRYRVPGNIKKQLLVEVLQAARCGNEQEVDKLLADLRQNRKKRIRKGKPTKLTMSLASTPIHSPNYDMADDYYAAQHRLPYQWVGAEEEIPNRQLDESNRVPQYEEFRQFLLRRIQRDYQTYNTNNNYEKVESVDSGGIMDLRNDQGDSIRFDTHTAVGIRSNNIIPVSSMDTVQSYSEQIAHNPTTFDYQILEDSNGNGNASILLRRMLQAPVGADLGEIASPELGSNCRIWGTEHYQTQNNLLDNSDTLSANSDVNGNDDNCNWPIGTEYYRFVNNVRDQLIFNAGNIPGNKPNCDQPAVAGQFCSVLTDNIPGQYNQLMSDIQQQQGQQQWETAGPFDGDVLNYQKPKNQDTKIFPVESNSYYDGIGAANYATPRIMETDPLSQQYVNEDVPTAGYPVNQNGFEGNNSAASAPARSEMKFYQNLNNNRTERSNNPIPDAYSSLENTARQMNDPNNYTLVRPNNHSTNYYASGEAMQQTPGFIPPMQHLSFSNCEQLQAPPPAHNGYVENLGCTSQPPEFVEEFNRASIFGQYHNMINKGSSLVDESQQLHQHGDRDVIRRDEADGETEARDQNKTSLGNTSTSQSDSTMSLEPFWPQKSIVKNTADNCLENILNLNTYGFVDYSKIDQTSCVYCYSAPIVTQRLHSESSPCSQKKRFIAEFRQHTFSPYWLLYNDTSTGMQMLQHIRAADEIEEPALEHQNDEIINASVPGITDIALDLGNTADNLQMEDIHDSEFRLDEPPQLNSVIAVPIIDADQSHGREITSFNPIDRLDIKSDDLSCGNSHNDRAETAESSINLNMENMSQKDEVHDENYSATGIIEFSENLSTNIQQL